MRRHPPTPQPRAHDDLQAAVVAATERVADARGDADRLGEVFAASQMPLMMIDNGRRYTHANLPARLAFRLPLAQLRRHCIDDLTPASKLPLLERLYDTLMKDGAVSGTYEAAFPDRSRLALWFAALKNVLPGQHLIAFLPLQWPLREAPPVAPRREALALTPRQRDVLARAATGAPILEIAADLRLSPATVRTHLRDALGRLGARNRVHAIALAIAAGEISFGGD